MVNYHDTHERLLSQVRDRLQNGELTERSLARHLGISQPHVNNVLRGRRKLSLEIADLLLKFLHVSLLDLYADGELKTSLHSRMLTYDRGDVAAVLKGPLGRGKEWGGVTDGRSRYHCPAPVVCVPGCSVFARLDPDERMAVLLDGCDIALLDTSVAGRLADFPGGVFAVGWHGGTVLPWLRGGSKTLYLAHELNLNQPLEWELLPIQDNKRLEIAKGRVLWLGAESTLQRA